MGNDSGASLLVDLSCCSRCERDAVTLFNVPSCSYTFHCSCFRIVQGGLGLGLHFPGFPDEPDWTKALGVFATEEPSWFGAILGLICIAEGESVGHSGDNFRGKSSKSDQGNLNFDYLGLKQRLSAEKQEKYANVERM